MIRISKPTYVYVGVFLLLILIGWILVKESPYRELEAALMLVAYITCAKAVHHIRRINKRTEVLSRTQLENLSAIYIIGAGIFFLSMIFCFLLLGDGESLHFILLISSMLWGSMFVLGVDFAERAKQQPAPTRRPKGQHRKARITKVKPRKMGSRSMILYTLGTLFFLSSAAYSLVFFADPVLMTWVIPQLLISGGAYFLAFRYME